MLILVDDLGWTDLTCQGSRYFETPHIDRLAARGMRFTNGYAACAVCIPTRAAVQTGRYPARLGVTDWIRARFQAQAWSPAQYDTSGIRRVAVLEFGGDSGSGRIARSALTTQLTRNGFFEVVELGNSGPGHVIGGSNVQQALRLAQARGVDGLLVGEVVSYGVNDDVQRNQSFEFGNLSEQGKKSDKSLNRMGFNYQNDETITREVSASLSFRLIDVRTGQVRAANQASYTTVGKMTNGEGYLPAREATQSELMQKCSLEIVNMLAPHQESFFIDLAYDGWGAGSSDVRAGNRWAIDGDWRAAEDRWRSALEIDSTNHAAMHNLAVACEARQDYAEAERLLADALAQEQSPTYARTSARMRRHKEQYQAVLAQRESRSPRGVSPPVYAGPPVYNGPSAGGDSFGAAGSYPPANGVVPVGGHATAPKLPWATFSATVRGPRP